MIKIAIQNCNQCLIDGSLKVLNKLYNLMEVRHPNAWQIRMSGNKHWDGKIRFLSETGKFKIGLLPHIVKLLEADGHEYSITDMRAPLGVKAKVPEMVGKLKARPEQLQVMNAVVNNKIGGVPFHIGVQNLSVNFGKSMIMAGLYLAYKKQLKTLILTNDQDWLKQAQDEFKDLLPGESITYVQGAKVTNWNTFSIGMVQSISRNLDKYQEELSNIDMLLIDECDLIDNKTYKKVIERLWNTRIRLGLSGTIYMSKLKKDLLHDMNIRSFLGDELSIIKLDRMIKAGYSTPVIVKMVPMMPVNQAMVPNEYSEEYTQEVQELQSYATSFKRFQMNYDLGRFPMIVVTKYIAHCEELYKFYKNKLESDWGKRNGYNKIRIEYVHHETKNRKQIISDFREGKIDILISTTIIARGKNFPLLQYLQNAGDLDSNEKVIQLLGRLVRTSKTKKKAYLDDLCYNSKRLARHAKHRKNYYIRENLKVIDLHKKHHRYSRTYDLPF